MSNSAFQITEVDVETVLRRNSLAVADSKGKSFESMAAEIYGDLDHDAIEAAALYGSDMDEQTDYALAEIERQLRESGVLEPLKPTPVNVPRG
jgi:hypothetical protein